MWRYPSTQWIDWIPGRVRRGDTQTVDATARQTLDPDVSSIGAAARTGSRAALAAMGRIGGKRRAERARERKAGEAAAVLLGTVGDMRTFLEARAGEVAASDECATAKANAAARLVGALTELDGLGALARENASLRTECALLRARVGTGEGLRLTWSDDPDEAPAAPRTDAAPVPEPKETP